ncbi:MAG: sulfite exporter TauE/SafE family protein [Hymenobacteraceae bacterium]|nr:sulfite exporter TauE/SafE family protein [Hymenobacteraceae bacterium]MDX5395099.1 sulfite exporter TauE/SafE family protein [Hymenobacteraceae bacterium]MDX5511137.1 sulfite exporter TauE/SafE family protein [Hymenobacteraceae bacterium]
MIWAGFLFGLLGSFHCVGMCGPIALALPMAGNSKKAYVAGRLLYNGGRIITYTLLGALAGVFGETLQLAGLQQTVSVISGILILLMVVLPQAISGKVGQATGMNTVLAKVKQVMARHFQKGSFSSLGIVGMLNGLLPCGFVYLALAGAISMKSVGASMAYMALFGAGTLPLMLMLSLSGKLIRPKLRYFFSRSVPYAATFMAVLFILRGLNLGIPYLSPELVHHQDKTELSCCSKPQH